MAVGGGPFLGGLNRGKELVARGVVVEEVLGWDSEVAFEYYSCLGEGRAERGWAFREEAGSCSQWYGSR